jgi:hypothetical protein
MKQKRYDQVETVAEYALKLIQMLKQENEPKLSELKLASSWNKFREELGEPPVNDLVSFLSNRYLSAPNLFAAEARSSK